MVARERSAPRGNEARGFRRKESREALHGGRSLGTGGRTHPRGHSVRSRVQRTYGENMEKEGAGLKYQVGLISQKISWMIGHK